MRYKCIVLDHDDTVVASEASVNYPCFLKVLERFRPGQFMELNEFTYNCFIHDGFPDFMRSKYQFTDWELKEEFLMWQDYAKTRIPPAYAGIREIVLEQKKRGGLVCVSSHSGLSNILRDYKTHFGVEPDAVYSWDMPAETRKPAPYSLLKIMEKYSLEPKDLLMIDDLKPGYDMAKKAGVDFAFAGWGRQNVPQITEFMLRYCDYAFQSTQELYDFLFK